MSPERGSTTIWMLGLSLLLLLFGGLALDYWRGLAMQRELAAVADSAAIAAASGIDEGHYRSTGAIVLDPSRAHSLALAIIDFQEVDLAEAMVTVSSDGLSVTVSVRGSLSLGLLGVFTGDDTPFAVHATATASPRRIP